jgi:hypothetical protein
MSSSLKVTRRFSLGGKKNAGPAPAAPSARPLIRKKEDSQKRGVATSSAASVNAAAAAASAAASFDLSPVPPAKLEGTRASFPLSANRLITLAQDLFATDTGVEEGADDLLAGERERETTPITQWCTNTLPIDLSLVN